MSAVTPPPMVRPVDRLVWDNLRLVPWIVQRMAHGVGDTDELIAIGHLALVKAARSYDPTCGVRFATYATQCVVNEIRMHWRGDRRQIRATSLNNEVVVQDGDTVELLTLLPADMPSVEDTAIIAVMAAAIRRHLADMPQRDSTVIEKRYLASPPMTHQEIATQLGISRSYVAKIEYETLTRLRQRIVGGDGSR